MKLLGLTGGRKMGNSETLLRTALMAAKEVKGIEVEIIRLWELNIKKPLGENAKGKTQVDHSKFLNQKIRESDGIILACPAYSLTPPGYTINIRDRVSLRGLPLKLRPAAMIGVGGSDWTSLHLPLMYTILPQGECKIVDQMLVNFEAPFGSVAVNDKLLERAKKLGRNVAEAMKMPIAKVEYLSEEPWACPICRQNLLIIRGDKVECSICDVRGTIEKKGGKLVVTFKDEDLKTYRWGPEGCKRHGRVIMEQNPAYKKNLPEITKRCAVLEKAIPVTHPPKQEREAPRAVNEKTLKKSLLDV